MKMRQPVYDCCAADRERARLPQVELTGTAASLEILWFNASYLGTWMGCGPVGDSMVWRKCLARRRPCGNRRAAGDGLRSGPGDADPNDGPAARFAAEAARYEVVMNRLFVASRLACERLHSGPGDPEPNDIPKFGAALLEILWFGATRRSARNPCRSTACVRSAAQPS
jgi:hypothetical protein